MHSNTWAHKMNYRIGASRTAMKLETAECLSALTAHTDDLGLLPSIHKELSATVTSVPEIWYLLLILWTPGIHGVHVKTFTHIKVNKNLQSPRNNKILTQFQAELLQVDDVMHYFQCKGFNFF